MHYRSMFPAACLLLLAVSGRGWAEQSPLETLAKVWTPFMATEDPFAFPLKIESMCLNNQHFWGGGKDLFLEWCRANAQKWLADRGSYILQQGDPNFGNIGTYLAESSDRSFGNVAFGLLDFDESCRLPVQIELLQGAVTLRLLANDRKIRVDSDAMQEIIALMQSDYRMAAASTRSAGKLLDNDRVVKKIIKDADNEKYKEDLAQYTDGRGRFRGFTQLKSGEVRDLLEPAMPRADEISVGIAHALAQSKRMRKMFNYQDAASIRKAIKDVAQRHHLGIAGSQGLRKYLVLLDKPIKGVDHDVILYLKQQVPAAPERLGMAAAERPSAGERCAMHIDELTNPRPLVASWCDLGSESYWVSVKHPWTKELETDGVKTYSDLLHMARIWGMVVGASHRQRGEAQILAERLTPQLPAELNKLSEAYVTQLIAEYQMLRADPKARELVATARQAVRKRTEGQKP